MPITTKGVSSNPVHGEVYSIQHYAIKFGSDRSAWFFSVYSGFLHLWNWPPRYNWNIVESGVKHYKPNQTILHDDSYRHLQTRRGKWWITILTNNMYILYNYSLLLRSIRVFMDLKNQYSPQPIFKVHKNLYWPIQKTVIGLLH